MSNRPASAPDLTAWYSEVQQHFAALRTALGACPNIFLPSEIAEAIEEIDYSTVQIESELGAIAARMARWNEAVEA